MQRFIFIVAYAADFVLCVCVSDAQPTECERDVWNQVNAVLQESESILSGLQAYKGAGQEIRDVGRTSRVRELGRTQTAAFSALILDWFVPGYTESQRFTAPGKGVELRVSPRHPTEKVLWFLVEAG